MARTIADVALRGFAAASSYDRHRPSYPAEAIEQLFTHLALHNQHGARILDLAAGTGKFTELLAARRDERFAIMAVEPHGGMRAELERKQLPGVTVLAGDAASIPLETGSVDAVIVAQAFHWFAHNEALQEIHRVLVPGGVLGMIWNVEDYNAPRSWTATTAWEAKIKEITWLFDDNHPRFRNEQWREVFDKQLSTTPFTIQAADPMFSLPIGEDSVGFTIWLGREAIWERYHTLSQIAVLKGEELAITKAKVLKAIDESNVERNEKGELEVHGRTVNCWTSAIPLAPLKNGG